MVNSPTEKQASLFAGGGLPSRRAFLDVMKRLQPETGKRFEDELCEAAYVAYTTGDPSRVGTQSERRTRVRLHR